VTKLPVHVTHFPEQVDEAGVYTIKQYKQPKELQYGSSLILSVTDGKAQERSIFVPYSAETSDNNNLGRLVNGFGGDPERWIGKKIEVTFDKEGKRKIVPVVK
jgi:hypothetical protein